VAEKREELKLFASFLEEMEQFRRKHVAIIGRFLKRQGRNIQRRCQF